jgi:hypothetical protein
LVQALELVEDVRAHRRHAGTAADEHHLRIRVLGEKLAEGAVDLDLVAGLQVEHPGRHLPGGMPSLPGGGVATRMLNFTTPFSSG